MLAITTTMRLTSSEAFRIAEKLRDLERKALTGELVAGDSAIVHEQIVGVQKGLRVNVEIAWDQGRAEEAGLVG